jgi:nucleotide-binding universal stress UspA family protein
VIVLGRHRDRPAAHHAMGSTALGVVTNSWAPCLILGGPIRLPLERVLVPVDCSDTSRGALVVALSWASALRGTKKLAGSESGEPVTLRALFVESSGAPADDFSGRRQALDKELDQLRQDAGSWANVAIDHAVVANSDVSLAIADYARDRQAHLIVIGTRGLGLDAIGRLGSVSLGVARRVAIPLLLVPPAVWSTYASAV